VKNIVQENNFFQKIIGFVSDNCNTVASLLNGVAGKLKIDIPYLIANTDGGHTLNLTELDI
jgi:hypothetical protein